MQITEIKNLIHDTVDTNTTTFPDVRMVRGLNKAQHKLAGVISRNDYLYQYDDDNYTDLPEGTLDLVSGQSDYLIKEDENFSNILFLVKIFILNEDDKWVELEKKTTFQITESGVPTAYRLTGKTVVFDKTPDYNKVAGIKVYFVRELQEISINETTKEPGIPSIFHFLLALLTAYDYARAKRMDNRNDILREVELEQENLGLFVKTHDKGARTPMRPLYQNNR